MNISKTIVFAFVLLFFCSGLAQTDKNSGSKKSEKNSGLAFKKELEHRFADSSYTDVIQLLNLKGKAQALQFRILINKAADDSAVILLKDIQKGSDIKDPGWLLDYNVIKGSVDKNGTSKDEIFVLLYNSNYNSGLLPGDYYDFIKVNYKIADLPKLKNEIKSSLKISNAEASTFDGFPVDIKPVRDEFKIYIRNK
jgi:hypothetical protein